jgi:23S rRNA (adenine2503-C2)-methyltransferase
MTGNPDTDAHALKRQSPHPRNDLAGLDFAAFSAWCAGVAGHHPRFHRASYRQVMDCGRWAPGELPLWREAEATSPGTIAALSAAAADMQRPLATSARETVDPQHGLTVKVLSRLHDDREVESVLIPMRRGSYHTICVSSQVGCKMGCTFCQTARMGLVRQLAAHEIVGQVLTVVAQTGIRPRNLVFMGMGEPLDNLDEVARAVAVLTDGNGLRMSASHITISTVGRVDQFPRLVALDLLRVNLAVSLTAGDDALRSRLMPVNRTWNLQALKHALLALPLPPGRRLLISYVLIAGLNDTPGHADSLIAWLSGLTALVNLIPLNPIPGYHEQASPAPAVADFRARLIAAGVAVRLRQTKGDAVMAACGQLGHARRPVTPRPDPGALTVESD